MRTLIALCLLLACPLAPAATATAADAPAKYVFKIASLAPEGSIWAKCFQAFAKEVEEKSNREIGFKIYPGGVMGDDRAMYRKMRVGQLDGGGFTMTGISEVVSDFRVFSTPFLFRSYEEVDLAMANAWPRLKAAADRQDLVLLARSEVGFVHTISTLPVATFDDLRKSKCWAPEGDPISKLFLTKAGVTPIPLTIPDVLPAFQTGMIDTAFNSFYGAIALQWFTQVKYITDVPFAYAYGALVLTKRSLQRLPPAHAELMESAAHRHFNALLDETRKSNRESLEVLKDNGVQLLPMAEDQRPFLEQYRQQTIDELTGDALTKDLLEAIQQLLAAERGKQ